MEENPRNADGGQGVKSNGGKSVLYYFTILPAIEAVDISN